MNTLDLENRLKEAYPDCQVAVIDLTDSGSNFEIRIMAEQLKDLSRVKQHQAIMSVFKEELATGEIHALAIKTLNP